MYINFSRKELGFLRQIYCLPRETGKSTIFFIEFTLHKLVLFVETRCGLLSLH